MSFLDHHIRVGDSLLGATPELIAAGLPDGAFKPIPGDDSAFCMRWRKRNRTERDDRQFDLGLVAESRAEYDSLAARSRSIDQEPDGTLDEVRRKYAAFHDLERSPKYRKELLTADAWAASFVWPKRSGAVEPVTTDTLRRLGESANGLSVAQRAETERLANRYRFFHWHLAFPEVYEAGGFDCVLGNVPWEVVRLQEKEWFSERSPQIAAAPNAATRKRMITALATDDPPLHQAFEAAVRVAAGASHFLRDSGRYPLCGRGTINLYAVFAELMRSIVNPARRVGCVLPTGIATDDTTKVFFADVVAKRSLISIFDFENRRGLFPDIDSRTKFCLFTAGDSKVPSNRAEFVFFAHAVDELRDSERRFTLSPEEIALLNPLSKTCPIFRSRRDAVLAKAIYRRVPILARDLLERERMGDSLPPDVRHGRRLAPVPNAGRVGSTGIPTRRQRLPRAARTGASSWRVKFLTMYHMAGDSGRFRTREELEAMGYELDGSTFRAPPGKQATHGA